MRIRLLTALLILPCISLATLNGCEKKAPIIIYKTPEPNSNMVGNFQAPQQQPVANADPGTSEPAPEETQVSEQPAPSTPEKGSAEETPAGTPDAAATTPAAAEPAETPASDSSIVIPDGLPSTNTSGGESSGSTGYTQSGSFNLYTPGLTSKIPLIGSFLDSTTTVNKWQASGVAVFGSNIFITAQDKTGLSFFKGTVIKMSADDGSGFTNLGKQWLGLKYQMDPTVKGIAMDAGGNIYANDSTSFLYVLNQPAYSVQKINGGFSDSIDIATVNTSVIVATSGGLKKYDPASLTSVSEFAAGITPTGGIGSDAAGNLYVVTSGSIKKITSSGTVSDLITGVSGAIDVVGADDKVFVLTSEGINMYDGTGKLLSTFGQGEYTNGTAIAASGKDIFVSDAGATYKDSKIVKYSI